MKRILLVAPLFESRHRVFMNRVAKQRGFMAPVAMATVAALTPEHFGVDLFDENIYGPIDETTQLPNHYDLVAVTGYSSQIGRVKAISTLFRKKGIPVALGGPAVSTSPERYLDLGDHLFIGEAEYTWAEFLKDWENGAARRMYRQVIKPELSASPVPRWELLGRDIRRYFVGAVQTSRGCPFDCEFCDVPYIFGHRPRAKPVSDVLKEIERLHGMGVDQVFFCDDNSIGDLRYAKNLLKELVVLNRKFERPVQFFTQMTLNVAKHDDVLEMMADAHFAGLFIGIETPNIESLKETKKLHNAYTDILADVHKIQSFGLALWSGVIVGFDHDTPAIFEQQFQFLQSACIPMPIIHLLHAPQGTRLFYRMQKEGRLVAGEDEPVMPKTWTNVIPAGMSRAELFRGHLELHERIRDWDNFAARMKGFISGIKRPRTVRDTPRRRAVARAVEFLVQRTPFLIPSLRALGMQGKARRTIIELLQFTLDHAPYLFPRIIMPLLIVELRQVELLRQVRPLMMEQIELESAPDFQVRLAEETPLVPESFTAPYNKIFPTVYARVQDGLADKTRVQQALIDIFSDFLSRWSGTLEQVGEHHLIDLDAISAEVIARENAARRPQGLVRLASEDKFDYKKAKLPEEILRAAEQEIRIRAEGEPYAMAHASPF